MTLTEECYRSMFAECVSLKNAPELPATELGKKSYANMFKNCYSLTKAPKIPDVMII